MAARNTPAECPGITLAKHLKIFFRRRAFQHRTGHSPENAHGYGSGKRQRDPNHGNPARYGHVAGRSNGHEPHQNMGLTKIAQSPRQ